MRVEIEPSLLCQVGGQLLEGPYWAAEARELRFVDIRLGELLCLSLDTGRLERTTFGRSCSAWINRRDGGSVVACEDALVFLDEKGLEEHYVPLEPELAANRANDAKCDPAGRLWVGTMSEAEAAQSGSLYRIEPGRLTRAVGGVTVSNGLGWSPDGRSMYHVDSPTRRIDVFDYDVSTGTASERRPLVDTSDMTGFPDGLAVDVEGCLWVAFWDGGSVHQFSPDGELVGTVATPATRPTSCAFIGADLESLAITTAAALDGTGGDVFVCEPDVAGMTVEAFDA